MKCPRCQQETPADADFCPECGAKLALVRAACGTANAPTHKFCKKCGQQLGSDAGSGQPSPRFLFADLKGSMKLLADRDPEEARRVLDPVLELMMEASPSSD